MCGTASNDIEAQDVVPTHRTSRGPGPGGAWARRTPASQSHVFDPGLIQGEVMPVVVGAYRAVAQ